MRRIRRPSHATVVAYVALFIALGGTAIAAVVVSDNSQVARGTISGHKPPAGDHPNVIAGSVNGTDLADGSVTRAKLKTPATFTSAGLPDMDPIDCSNPDNRWYNYLPSRYERVGYYRDPSGLVYLQGFAYNCGNGVATFTLPPGYAPAKERSFFGGSGGGVTANGEVYGSSEHISVLDGIVFRCGPSGQNGCP